MHTPRAFFSVVAAFSCLMLCGAGSVQAADAGAAAPQNRTVPSFQAKTTAGKTVNFPGDYRGKVVLLDFWATWCPPCRAEVPNLVKVHNQYRAQGFEVLGVSLDKAGAASALGRFTQEHRMTWPQIYDGKFWKADLAVKYGIKSIPRAILVDGDTGRVLADARETRGTQLAVSVQKAIAAKKKK